MRRSGQTSFAERAGGFLGRLWRTYRCSERRSANWLVARGLPDPAVVVVLWGIRLGVAVVLFHTMSWLALLVTIGVIVMWFGHEGALAEDGQSPEWKDGHDGFGLYDKSEWRIDIDNSDD
ncbi:DUF3742 family protein [Acidomonas methanolica]|uniref:DUF3742 domain-containing protein n=1 Tax=Acidomonas methanolica NBRC 104435 TaxID=1231351 RepID=A0A023D584_ACIMT|nr:DUF3742 family protein [Acidomonas methanolica]MBU2654911.1 DUF3742 family protein [Acidomonas methanolica]GAJ29297.1 hypothetical protein Amme_059_016 [Acidomonas methanolica NBRC 104435]GBQ45654.1 hypothetical protein AA0498_0108 [Acidomonas methanolica]GEK99061.1 hypothetical protein AME01nite_15600 [Acidomonas methanolica NBRC 104435]